MNKIIINEQQYKKLLNEITLTDIQTEAEKVNLNPTDPQKKASNYKMGHIRVKGMKIAIENPVGSKRYYGQDGKYNVMKNHYGYFNVSKGKDGDAVDVFLGPDIEDFDTVYCIDQNTKDGDFDETKVMLGFTSKEQAKNAYLSNYEPNWKGFRAITAVSLKTFKKWLYRGRKQRQPFSDYVEIKKKELKENKDMKVRLTEEQLLKVVNECVNKVLNERDYYAISKRTEPKDEKEYQNWLNKKSASKKLYRDELRKNMKSDSKAIDYKTYKHGEHPEIDDNSDNK